jgi:hypothetical protein
LTSRGCMRQRAGRLASQSQNTTTGPRSRDPGGLAVVCSESCRVVRTQAAISPATPKARARDRVCAGESCVCVCVCVCVC